MNKLDNIQNRVMLVSWLVGFYGISTFVGYFTLNPFQTIQFSISTQFKFKYSLIVKNISISNYLVLSNNSVEHKYAVSSI